MNKSLITIVVLFVLLALAAAQQNATTNATNCSNPVFSVDSFKARNQTRPRFLDAPAISELKYCKVFSNKTSCCNAQTDSDIQSLFQRYKDVLSNLTTRKFRDIKKGFEDYSNVDLSAFPDGDKAKEKVGQVVQVIKARLNQTTKGVVACARQALKVSAGLLCSGCNANWGRFVKNNRLVLSNNSCLALSNACYGLLRDFKSLQNDSKSDVANLTNAITEFIGEELPPVVEDVTDPGRRLQEVKPPSPTIPTNVNKDYNRDTYCKKWTDTVASSCAVCDFDFEKKSRDEIKNGFNAISPDCLTSGIFKATEEVQKKLLPKEEVVDFFRTFKLIDALYRFTNFALRPAVIKLKDGNILPFIVANETMNNNWIALIQSKVPFEQKKRQIDGLIQRVKSTIEILDYLVEGEMFPLATKEYFIEVFDQTHFDCIIRGSDFLRREMKKGPKERYFYKVFLTGETAGTVVEIDKELPNKSKLPEFLKNCSKNSLKSTIKEFSVYAMDNGITRVCFDEYCTLASIPLPQRTPSALNQSAAVSNFDNVKRSGGDPQRMSLATGRKVPDLIDLPKDVNKVIEGVFKAPCDNVTHCAQWFCTKFLNGPFARVEKVVNPQNEADSLDSEAAGAYNADLKRLLQAQSENELSADGLNFIAIAENSAFDSSIVVDGVSEEAAGFDATIKANSTFDPSVIAPAPASNNTKNETKGNGLIGKIESQFLFMIILVIGFVIF